MSRIFDPGPLTELRLLDPDSASGLVNNLIQMFSESAPAALAEVIRLTKADNLKSAAEIAHSLKSSAGNLGAMAFSYHCQEIETEIHNGQPGMKARVAEHLQELEKLLPATLAILEEQRSTRH